MNCNICHHPNDEDNAYCENCGIKLLPSVAGEVWRAKDIVSFFSESLLLDMDFFKAVLFTTFLAAIGFVLLIYILALPLKYASALLILFFWTGLLQYRNTHKVLKSLSLTDRNKKVVAHGPASLVGPAATIGGWLYLMSDGLIFTPESYFVNSNVVSIPFCRVRSQSAELGFRIKNDQFRIITTEGQEFIYAVYNRENWSRLIDSALSERIQSEK